MADATTPSHAPAPKDRRMTAIFLVVLIDILGLTIILPLLPFYAERFKANPLQVGALVSVYALCQMIAGPFLGHWSDRIGRKPVLIISQIGTFIGFLILASAQSLIWIFVSRIMDGLTAGNLSTAQAYITDIAAPQDRAKQLGKIGIAFGLGFFVGPTLTASLSKYGYQVPIYVAAGLSALSILASAVLLPKETIDPVTHAAHPDQKYTSGISQAIGYLRNPALGKLMIQIALFYFSFSAFMAGFALFCERRFTVHGHQMSATEVGYALAYFGFLGILLQGFMIGPLVKRFGERSIVYAGFIASTIGYGMMAFIDAPLWIAITGIFTGFGTGVLRPVLIAEMTAEVGPHERGRLMGANQALQSLAQIIAPMIATAFILRSMLPEWAMFGAILNLIGVVFVMMQRRKSTATDVNV